MRQISFDRPKAKVRGSKRRLKALDEWSESFDEFIPEEWCDEKYVDFRIPVLDRLLDPPTTTPEWQKRVLAAFFRALQGLHKSCPEKYKDVPVDLIIHWPDLSSTSIILFFDKNYHEDFYERDGEWQKRIPEKIEAKDIPFDIPSNVEVKKVKFMNRDYDGEETTDWYITDWYVCTINS